MLKLLVVVVHRFLNNKHDYERFNLMTNKSLAMVIFGIKLSFAESLLDNIVPDYLQASNDVIKQEKIESSNKVVSNFFNPNNIAYEIVKCEKTKNSSEPCQNDEVSMRGKKITTQANIEALKTSPRVVQPYVNKNSSIVVNPNALASYGVSNINQTALQPEIKTSANPLETLIIPIQVNENASFHLGQQDISYHVTY